MDAGNDTWTALLISTLKTEETRRWRDNYKWVAQPVAMDLNLQLERRSYVWLISNNSLTRCTTFAFWPFAAIGYLRVFLWGDRGANRRSYASRKSRICHVGDFWLKEMSKWVERREINLFVERTYVRKFVYNTDGKDRNIFNNFQ